MREGGSERERAKEKESVGVGERERGCVREILGGVG